MTEPVTDPAAAVLAIVRDLAAAYPDSHRLQYDAACQAVERAGIFPGPHVGHPAAYDVRIHEAVMEAHRVIAPLADDGDEMTDDGLEETFLAALAGNTDWELWDTGSVPETGLRCLHCGYEETFSDRNAALMALSGQIECDHCPPTEPDGAPYFALGIGRGGKLDAEPTVYHGDVLLRLTATRSDSTAIASLLLDADEVDALYLMLGSFLHSHHPHLYGDPMGDHMRIGE